MSAQIVDGKAVSNALRGKIKEDVEYLRSRSIVPGLAVVLVGENPASMSYVKSKERACEQLGIRSFDKRVPEDITEADLLNLIDSLNKNVEVHGILVQLPLPKHIDEDKVIESIDWKKDVDGFHPVNVGRMHIGKDAFLPCTPHGILKLLDYYNIETSGKKVTVLGRSNIVGKPIAALLGQKGRDATVTVCHSRTKNLKEELLASDIVIAAIGQPEMITADMLRNDAVVIDVGINRVEDANAKKGYRLVGDVAFDQVLEKAAYLTPVPGGVGPMTITMLLYNTVESAKKLEL